MKSLILKLTIFTTLIGVIAFSLNVLFDYPVVSYISDTYINGVHIYKYDFFSYLRSLQDSFTHTPFIQLTLPPNTPIKNFFEYTGDILNNIKLVGKNIVIAIENMINILITIANILLLVTNAGLYPLRIASYVVQVVLTLIGLPFDPTSNNPLNWLITFIKTLTQLEIPYLNFVTFNYNS